MAAFDVHGQLLDVVSKRGFRKAAMREWILEHGSPIVIASDVVSLPKGMEKIVSSFESEVVLPESQWEWRDKKRILEAFLEEQQPQERPWKNVHEKDAIIAGYHAWKRIRPRLEKQRRKGV